MNLKSLFNTLFGLAKLCLCITLMTATPTMAQTVKSVQQVSTTQDPGDLAKKHTRVGTIVHITTILRASLNNPRPNLNITSLEVYKLRGGEMVMNVEGCMEDVCEYDISDLPQGRYRVMIRTNHAKKSFGKVIQVW